MPSPHASLSWLGLLLLGGLVVWWRPLPVQAAAINLEQAGAAIIGRTEAGISVDPETWAAVWWSGSDRPECAATLFQSPTTDTPSGFSTTEVAEARLAVPLAANNQFVCWRAAAGGDWVYSDWLAVRVQAAELSLDQRHQFVTVTATQPVTNGSWRGLLVADECPPAGTIDQSLSPEMVRLRSPLQLVLEVTEEVDGQWLCVVAVDRDWDTLVFGHHRLSRLTESPPTVSIERSGNRLQATAAPALSGPSWYFFQSLNQPNCRANPIADRGRVTDPPFGEWVAGQAADIQSVGDNDEIWVCFIVLSSPDEFGNRVAGYGLYQAANHPPPTIRGLLWLIALNVFIICAGATIGILLYRNQSN